MSDEQFLARFEREAKAVAALSHSNIAGIHGFGKDPRRLYAVMEQIEGPALLVMDPGSVRLVAGNLYFRDWFYRCGSRANPVHLRSAVIPRHRTRTSV